ncbi:sugar ABC transporter substrate-binding protein [Cellulomonas shaoxiangyii]|uniref:Extracellular solute-binding protein n=1 Tax=Cellulomonas shaoxiangyii TaxID=2566013 RepID=A0A4P7SLK8_9CELL|nr:extracellular solute-binding protein [Cellulomonas shaoxiangyii]QCB94407.1 extracellular solute-binding protein [Cellulomonas shaoxiangyii]TGY80172.1 extracellular solute-binding protein [Cellulomonas shaoxiangyii]
MTINGNDARPTPRRRPRLALTSLATVSTLLLAACSGGTSADGGGDDGGSAGGDTVTVWHYFSDENQVRLMDELGAKFESEHDGVSVDNVFVPYDQLNSKLVSAAGAQTGPDVVVFNGAEASTLALGGALAPLDDYWADYADADQFPESVVHTIEDTTYAVQGYVNLLGLWYNADILAEIGVEPPTTMDELEDAMAKAKDAGYAGITLSGLPQSQGEWQAYPWITSEGFTYEDPQADALAAGLSRVRGWVESGWLSQEAVTWDQTVPFQQFAAGKTAFAANGNWQMGTAESDAEFEYGVVPLPLSETGGVYLGGEGQGIGAFSENPDLAWDYLTATYLDAEGQALPAEIVGSLPSRADAAADEVVTGNALLQPFAQSITQFGANYPSGVIPPEAVADVQLTLGQAWSAAIGGQKSPQQAADDAIAAISPLLD